MRPYPPALRRIVRFLFVLMVLFLTGLYIFQDVQALIGQKIESSTLLLVVVLVFAFVVSLLLAYLRVTGVVQHYTKVLYDLDDAHASDMVAGIMFQVPRPHRARMTLKVKDGRLDTESASTVRRVGGPGWLNIEAEHFVVTSRFGLLHRTLEAGHHKLDPFEKVWDVIDLRPQYRELTVSFTTASGIPAQCKANMLFRIAQPKDVNAFNLAIGKYVKSASGRNRLSDWTFGIANGALDGAVRDLLEFYDLDQFIKPPGYHFPAPQIKMSELEEFVRNGVTIIGKERGILVEQVELSEIKPEDEAVMRQWQQFWHAQHRIDPDRVLADSKARTSTATLMTYAGSRAELVQDMVQKIIDLARRLPPGIITQEWLDALVNMLNSEIYDATLNTKEGSAFVKQKLLP